MILFRAKKLENILASFNEVIEDLADLEEQNEAQLALNQQELERIAQHNVELTEETIKAKAVRAKIAALVSS